MQMTETQKEKQMVDMQKFRKSNLQFDKWIAHNQIGEALKGKLIHQVTPTFCPEEVQKVLDAKLEEIYEMGFASAVQQIRDSLLVIEYEG